MSDAQKAESPPPEAVLLIHEAGHPLVDEASRYATEQGLALVRAVAAELLAEGAPPPPDTWPARWIVACGDEHLPLLMDLAARRGAELAFLPGPGSVTPRLFGLPRAPDAQIALAFSQPALAIDLTRCNDEVVLSNAAIGDVPFLDHRGRAFLRNQPTRWLRAAAALGLFWGAVRRLFAIRPSSVRISIGEEEKPRRTAVTGIVVLENDAEKISHALLGERLSARDGRLSALLVAPASVVAYLALLVRAVFGGGRMPRALSFVRTGQLLIESDQELAYRLDGRRRSAKRIAFSAERRALKVVPGAGFGDDNPLRSDERDTLRLRNLPENELRLASISARLPLFTHALEEDFKDLFQLLRDNATVTPDYVVLMLSATLIAGLGLVLGSPAVIIGAMVLAPLMAPIVSLAMAMLRASARAIGIGAAIAISASALLAWIMPLRPLTAEIDGRLHPTLLDLGVAVVSGVAAAYAHARESVMKSMSGVAIAVALVPPLAVSGIGIGWGDARIFGGALLLFLTNLVGISAAAALTFLVLGYAPIRTAVRGLRVLALATLLMALPLYFSLSRIVEVWRIESQLRAAPLELAGREIALEEPQVSIDDGLVVVRTVVAAPDWLDAAAARAIKQDLERRLQRPVRLELELRLVQ